MKEKNLNINDCIGTAFRNCGYTIEYSSSDFEFKSLSLKINGEIDELGETEKGKKSARLKIKLDNKFFINSIYEYVYGWGDSVELAIINAFERWIDSDFPVIHDLLADHKIKEGYTTEIKVASKSGETGEEISWKGIIGPLLTSDESKTIIDEANRNEIMLTLFNEITGDFLGERGMYPIKCFMSKNSNHEVDIDCRVNGITWSRGQVELYKYCQTWKTENFKFWKQYFIIYSLEGEIEEGKLKDKFKEAIKEPRKKSWWKFWG